MLVSFSVKNVYPFKQRIELWGVPEKGNSLPFDLVSMYGANGIGKTSFLSVISCLRDFVLGKTVVIPFSSVNKEEPMVFSVQFLVDEKIYLLEFSCLNRAVVKESLSQTSSGKEEIIYTRDVHSLEIHECQLLLSIELHNDKFPDIKSWFESLCHFSCFLCNYQDKRYLSIARNILYSLGIEDVVYAKDISQLNRFAFSNGIERLLFMLGFFVRKILNRKPCVFFVDDFGSGLHPSIAIKVLELFKRYADKHKNVQMIFSTHMVELMNFNLVQKDATFVFDKNRETKSVELYSLNCFDSTYDGQVKKAYMQGVYGGVPD